MKKLVLFMMLVFCTVSFAVPAWSKKDGDPPVMTTGGNAKVDTVIFKRGKDGDPPVMKTGRALNVEDIVKDGDPPAPPKP